MVDNTNLGYLGSFFWEKIYIVANRTFSNISVAF